MKSKLKRIDTGAHHENTLLSPELHKMLQSGMDWKPLQW